jgi:hypothetical protein
MVKTSFANALHHDVRNNKLFGGTAVRKTIRFKSEKYEPRNPKVKVAAVGVKVLVL